jgi:glycosyltransferase involved in cell wall biosynthesis
MKNPSIADLSRFPFGLGNKVLYQLFASSYAHKLHKKYHFDGIWAMMAHASGIPGGMFKSAHKRIPYLLTLQEGDPLDYIERLMRPVWSLFKAGFTKADYLQAISTYLLAWGKRMGFTGVSVVIPNGVDTAAFAQISSQEARTELRARYANEGETLLITTSRLVRKNAVDDVLHALAQLSGSVKFLILGIGPEEASLRALVQELALQDRVFFVGEVRHDELPLYLHASDIFIRPSRSEGMGNSFVEAMAAGIPVIATQEGGIADFLYDAKRNPELPTTGWAVDADSPAQLAQAIENILAHKDETKKVIATAKNLVSEKYDWNLIARDMQALFQQMLSDRVK